VIEAYVGGNGALYMCEGPAGDVFECLELTRAFAVTHVCDKGIGWRLMVLGVQRIRAGARAFQGGAGQGGRCLVGGFLMWL